MMFNRSHHLQFACPFIQLTTIFNHSPHVLTFPFLPSHCIIQGPKSPGNLYYTGILVTTFLSPLGADLTASHSGDKNICTHGEISGVFQVKSINNQLQHYAYFLHSNNCMVYPLSYSKLVTIINVGQKCVWVGVGG